MQSRRHRARSSQAAKLAVLHEDGAAGAGEGLFGMMGGQKDRQAGFGEAGDGVQDR